jgi:cellulose synthase/poly-beta-1,6-N-acetylglucosamine synthase-like glycosyltransferase
MKDYISLSLVKDLSDQKEKLLYRFLEIFPGFLSWGTILSALLLSWLAPAVVAIFIILFSLYWLLKITYLSFHQISSFKKMKENLKIDWLKRLEKLRDWRKIYHLIILPTYNESESTISASCQALVNNNYPKDRMIVVLATEERAGEKAQMVADKIKGEFADKFLKFAITKHPDNLKDEIAGKGSNTAWAITAAKEKIIKPLGINTEHVIVSSFDIDTRPYPNYFACLTYNFLIQDKPQKCCYQPIPVYNNNIWKAPAFSRVIATSGSFWQMMQQERPDVLVTYSSHSTPLKVLDSVGYPKNVVSDDSRIFWKAYLFYDGDYKVVPLYYPVSMDAVLAKNLKRTIINQYKQQRRWAWGCNDIPFLLFGFFKNKKVPIVKKLNHSINVLDGFWSWATASFLIFFLGWLPLIVGGQNFNITLLSYNLPRMTGAIMTISMFGMIVSAIISLLVLPPRPKNMSKINTFLMMAQWLLLPITLILFGGIPALDAQTRLLIGKHLGFWVTEKV